MIEKLRESKGLASAEAVLFTVFILMPLFVLSITVLLRAAAAQNANAAARHGAFRVSMEGAKHYEDRVGLGGRRYRVEDEIKQNIAYFPKTEGTVLTKRPGANGRMTVTAAMRYPSFLLDYDRQLRANRIISDKIELKRPFTIMGRTPGHFDNVGAPMHSISAGAMEAFNIEVTAFQALALIGPEPFRPL